MLDPQCLLTVLELSNNRIRGIRPLARALRPRPPAAAAEAGVGAGRGETDKEGGGTGGTNDDSTAAAAVWVFPCLQHLGLGHNAIGPQGAEAIARAITPDASGRYNTSLASLDLEDTGIKGFVGFDVRAARGGGGGADDDGRGRV